MRGVLLVSLFDLGLAVSTQPPLHFPSKPTATGLTIVCDKPKLNDGNPFQMVAVFIRKNGDITWNGEPVTKETFEKYIQDDASHVGNGEMVYTTIGEQNESPAWVAEARALKTDAIMQRAVVPDCPLRGSNGHLL